MYNVNLAKENEVFRAHHNYAWFASFVIAYFRKSKCISISVELIQIRNKNYPYPQVSH